MSDVRDAIDALNLTGRVTTPLRSNQRNGLYALLRAYVPDMDDAAISLVGERDLIAMYEAACVDLARGHLTASRIAAKYAQNPLLDQPAQTPATVAPPPTPAPRPSDMSRYAIKSDVDRDMSRLRSDMNTDYRARVGELKLDVKQQIDELRDNTAQTLIKLTDAIPDVVRAQAAEAFKALTPVTLHVVTAKDAPPTPLGMVHRKLPALLQMLGAGGHVYLYGPAGSGKTTAARQCADAFNLQFYFAAKVESEYMLLGFKDARGETVRTQFREAYEHGGVFLFDELDGSSPSAVVAMNAALANGICPFPDGVIHMHENFKCIGGGNTKLSGATSQYVGRNQLDAASVDRFDFLEWPYDEAMECALATNANWCAYVQSARKAVAERALKHLVTPRATLRGCKLLEAGLTWEEIETAVLWKGLDAETVRQLKGAMTIKAPVTPTVSIL